MEEATSIAVCLFYLGGKTVDHRLLEEARHRYKIGRQLASELTVHSDLNAVLDTTCKLITCEVYQTIACSSNADDALDSHINGMCDIIRASENPATVAKLSPFQIQHFRFKAVMRSLICRRAVVDERIWRAYSRSPLPPVAETLIQLARRLVMLLEKTYSPAIQSASNETTVEELITQLLDLEASFAQWLSGSHDCTGESLAASAPEVRASLDSQNEKSHTHPTMNESIIYTGDLLGMSHISFYSICVLLLRQALFDISANCSRPISERDFFADATVYVDCLCQIIQEQTTSPGCLVTNAFLLQAHFNFGSEWFGRTNDSAKLQWCREQEEWLLEKVSFLNSEAVLCFSFHAVSFLEHIE